jgi:hypothetical protein
VLGNSLSLRKSQRRDAIVFAKGLGMHSFARADYANEGGYDRFMATVGIDSETQGYGDCQMIVQGDDAELWTGRVRAGDDPLEIDIDISRVRRISLIVEPGAQLDMADHADWCNARLVKTK